MNEEVLCESSYGELVLSDRKVRLTNHLSDQANVSSIMLEELTSCEVRSTNQKALLILAAVALIGGLLFGFATSRPGFSVLGAVVAAVFVIAYYANRRNLIILASPSAQIEMNAKGIDLEEAISIIDKIENAKYVDSVPVSRAESENQRVSLE